MTKIEYNGSVVATVEGGNTATLPIKDKQMATDIVITVPKAEGEVIPDHTQSDFTLQLANIASGELGVVYSSTEKVAFEAAPSGEVIDTFVDTNFLPSNIKKDVEIFGVTGEYEGEGEVIPEYTEVEDFEVFVNGLEGEVEIGYSVSEKVALPAGSPARLASLSDEDFIADNIRKGKNIFGLEGAFEGESSGGGAELNIAYGDTAPEDTSKLWVKTTQPSAVKVAKELQKVFEEGSSTVTSAGGSANMNYGSWAPMGNRIYGFGGNQGGGYTTNIFYYDTSTEQKVTLGATLPVNVCFASACACGSKIYLFGGREGSAGACLNTIYCLDTQTDTLTTLSATLSQTLRATASAAYRTKIYIFGGSNGDKRINAIHCFDCETETISTLSTVLPVASSNFAVSNYKDYIYIFGGYNSDRSIWKFDCETETIDIVNTPLPVYLSDGCAATIAKSIFVFGYSNKILCFDIEAETIKTLSATMPNTLNYPGALATEDDKIYIVSDKSPYCFSLDMKVVLDNGTLQIQSAFAENLFNLINTDTAQVEIGVNAVYKGNADGIAEVVEASLHNGTSWVTI